MAALAGLVVLVGLIASLAGPVCLFAPHKLRLNSRWYSVPLTSLFIPAIGIAMMIGLGADDAGKVDGLRGTGFTLLLLWGLLVFATHRLATQKGVIKQSRPEGVLLNPTRSADEVDERRRLARRTARGGQVAEPSPICFEFSSPASIEVRLDEAHARFKRGEIDADEYAEAIDDADNDLVDREEDLAADRSLMDGDYEEARQQLRDVAAEIRKHRKLASKRAYTESISRPDFADRGKWARFEYTDSDGVVTKRNIAMWERRGGYIVGFDRSKNAERTFRQDRISEWQCG